MRIRRLTDQDIHTCVKLGRFMHKESCYRDTEYSEVKCMRLGLEAISDDNVLWLVAEEHNIIGMLGAQVYQPDFSEDMIAMDKLVYVKPEHRGSTVFSRLIKEYLNWAIEKEAKLVFLATSTGVDSEKVERLYNRLGLKKMGALYQLGE